MKTVSTLDKIDNFLEAKDPKQQQTFYFGAFLLAALLVYLFAYQPAQDYFDDAEERLNSVTTKLNATNSYLDTVIINGDPNYKIKEYQRNLAAEQENYEELKAHNAYIDKKLQDLSSLTYNEENWAKFLDDVSYLAKQDSVKVIQIKSNRNELNFQKVEEVLDIQVQFEADFNDFLKYLTSIEESDLVVDVNRMDIEANEDDNLTGTIGISVWGMRYQ